MNDSVQVSIKPAIALAIILPVIFRAVVIGVCFIIPFYYTFSQCLENRTLNVFIWKKSIELLALIKINDSTAKPEQKIFDSKLLSSIHSFQIDLSKLTYAAVNNHHVNTDFTQCQTNQIAGFRSRGKSSQQTVTLTLLKTNLF